MPLIHQEIPAQKFELIRDQIGYILAEELNNQRSNGWLDLVPVVWVERAIPFDRSVPISINVRLNTGEYSGRDYTSVNGDYVYLIDFYASAQGTDSEDGDRIAAISLQRIMGMSRAILSNPAYKTLDLPAGFIGRVTVSTIAMGAPPSDADLHCTSRGQLQVNVLAQESELLIAPPQIARSSTAVKLYNTEMGFAYLWETDVEGGVFSNQFTIQFS